LELPRGRSDAGVSLWKQRRLLVVLGMPTVGLAFAMSAVTTYGPIVLIDLFDSSTGVGMLIGAQGIFALSIPLVVGVWSDRFGESLLGSRVPFVLAGAPLVFAGIVWLPFAAGALGAVVAVVLFFVGYASYYTPYRALYADLLPRAEYARALSTQSLARGVGFGAALLAGGLLLAVWQPLLFVIAAALVVVATAVLIPLGRRSARAPAEPAAVSLGIRELLVSDRRLRAYAGANVLWEFSLSGLGAFIVLYLVRGLDQSTAVASGVIAVVAVAYIVTAPVAGWLADRYGTVRTVRFAALVYGTGLTIGVFPSSLIPMLIGLPIVAVAGALLMTLSNALPFMIAPKGNEGAAAGIQDFTRGIGVMLGPIAVGLAINQFSTELSATDGYAALWPVIGIPVLISLLLTRTLQRRR
jgi:MFS family permease